MCLALVIGYQVHTEVNPNPHWFMIVYLPGRWLTILMPEDSCDTIEREFSHYGCKR